MTNGTYENEMKESGSRVFKFLSKKNHKMFGIYSITFSNKIAMFILNLLSTMFEPLTIFLYDLKNNIATSLA